MNVVEHAKALAYERHKGQCRPNKGKQPKIQHIAEVASLVKRAEGSEEMIAAAWLHDIVEDTATELEEISETFGQGIAHLVDGLTEVDGFEGMTIQAYKNGQAQRLQAKTDGVKLVKLCDQLSNIKSVLVDPPFDWSSDDSLAYIEGANELAKHCFGLSETTDLEFRSIYKQGVEKYSS